MSDEFDEMFEEYKERLKLYDMDKLEEGDIPRVGDFNVVLYTPSSGNFKVLLTKLDPDEIKIEYEGKVWTPVGFVDGKSVPLVVQELGVEDNFIDDSDRMCEWYRILLAPRTVKKNMDVEETVEEFDDVDLEIAQQVTDLRFAPVFLNELKKEKYKRKRAEDNFNEYRRYNRTSAADLAGDLVKDKQMAENAWKKGFNTYSKRDYVMFVIIGILGLIILYFLNGGNAPPTTPVG